MLIRYFIVVLLFLSVTYADVSYIDENGEENDVHERSPLDVKISAIISGLKTDIYRKMDDMEKKRSNKLDEIENKFNILQKTSHDLEENIYQKLNKLEKSILDKLEEYINGRIDSSVKHMYRKMDELEKILPDKTDINILNHNLNFLQKMPNTNSVAGSNICELKTLQNIKLEKNNEEINQKLNVIDQNISKLVNTTTHLNLDVLNQNFANVEENLNHKLTEISNKLPEIEHNISQTLTEHNNNVTKDFEMSINPQFNNVEKKIITIQENLISKFNTLGNTCIQNINDKLEKVEKKIPELQRNIIRRIDFFTLLGNEKCTKKVVSGFDYQTVLRMDNETFKYATVESDAAGLINFEMLLAIQTPEEGIILLSPENNLEKTDDYLALDIGDQKNTFTSIRRKFDKHSLSGKLYSTISTPKILSPSEFTAFNVKINDGTLEFNKVGSPPILKYKDELLRKVKYIGFSSWGKINATFLYDCPPNFNFEDIIV